MNLAVVVLNYNDPDNTNRYIKEIENYKCIDKIVVIDNNMFSMQSYIKLSLPMLQMRKNTLMTMDLGVSLQ